MTASAGRYPVPGARHRVEESIRRSRFITTVARAATGGDAHAFIDGIRAEFPDTTHNCWAFVAGPPGSTADVGMSDDGEPHGTVGRPMLEALLHSGVGEIAAVVTRYYGGVKLGKGGLQRAYSGGVQLALESMPRAERVRRVALWVAMEYAARDPVERVAHELDAVVTDEEYGAEVRLRVAEVGRRVDDYGV
ncbi:MAG: YigZ family protein, partial [Gemmatimonadota bacterium]